MFQTWADALGSRKVRYAFVVFGVLATVVLGPLSFMGASYAIYALAVVNPPIGSILVAVIGLSGVLAIAAAWVRVLVPRRKFKASASLRWVTAAALGGGVVEAGLMCLPLAEDPLQPVAWASVPVFAAGIFLLGATIGETKNAL